MLCYIYPSARLLKRLFSESSFVCATARKLLRMGLEVRNIAIATGLSIAEIESMK